MDRNRFYMLLGDLGILFVALIWGTTNVVIRDALDGITPLWFCGLRFAIAWATVMIFFGKKAFLLPKDTRLKSTLVGMVFICAYLCGAKRYCKQMTSCAEAKYHLTQCGMSGLDRDGDGKPCENVCN